MTSSVPRHAPRRLRIFTRRDIDRMPALRHHLSPRDIAAMKAVSAVLPFRVNNHVVDDLIDWRDVPDDPVYQLTFPQIEMLDDADFRRMLAVSDNGASEDEIQAAARKIQMRLNPHPAGQMELNVPRFNGRALRGMQHKYRETVLFFPSQGQTCHAYCTYCFRWAQFVGIDELKFANREVRSLVGYLRQHTEVTDVLLTGGDPLIMKSRMLRRYVESLLAPGLEHVTTIRIGTKATAYWPYRFLTDPDSGDLLRLFDEVTRAGKHLALMSHYSHPRELEHPAAQQALARILATGAVVRCQAPLIRHVNDTSKAWCDMWRLQVRLGAVPYYMFVERDTGAKNYFEVPLARAHEIFQKAIRRVSGLGRTVRGPSMSATPGKVLVEGITEIAGEKVFVLRLVQSRDPAHVNRVFFAKFDPEATWLDGLRPAFGEKEFFFEPELRRMREEGRSPAWANGTKRDLPVTFGHVEWE